ncbi:LuxR family two component transcriptional regulator [Stackebrandtia albiflava]|uniref:LuxR family two component transcriptional regulator n=1 Tax=Stackebrandtia albiflava TaxID=406432 RepID=A0A562UL47_9ACTN|nr:response regulator transcription factor [Stackebrandtia albiflava]TWJ06337.1 LuxR family two component transcriptional regulator [Stackebrandtia albiflava]
MRLFLVDDHPVVRAGLVALLAGEPDLTVVGEAADVAGAVGGIHRERPDLVLVDLRLEGDGDGVDVIRAVRAFDDPPQVLVLTTYETESDIVRALEAGATGYVLKAGPPEELFTAVRLAAVGETALSPRVAGAVMRRMRAPASALTAREIEILTLVSRGMGNRRIARELFVSEATVKTHLVHVYRKLGVDSRTAAVTVAVERGLIRR